MNINQRDVLLLPHPLENGHHSPHPHIVLSVQEANQHENTFIAVMITSSSFTKDDFSFNLNDATFEKPLAKSGCHARMHLITITRELWFDHNNKVNTMKPAPFNELMKSIGDLVFNYNFTPQ